MNGMKIQDLVNLAADAALDVDAAQARATRLKAAAIAEAERIRVGAGLSDRFPSDQGLGVLRLDGAGRRAEPWIIKPTEFADWLAQRAPDRVNAAITVPAEQLEDAMQALEFAGIGPAKASVTPAADAKWWLDDHAVVQADPDVPGAWLVLHLDAQRRSEVVPGVTGFVPSSRWVLVPNAGLRRERMEEATREAESLVAEPIDEPALQGPGPQ